MMTESEEIPGPPTAEQDPLPVLEYHPPPRADKHPRMELVLTLTILAAAAFFYFAFLSRLWW